MRRSYTLLPPLILLLLLSSTGSYGQAWSSILAPARATDWAQSGVPGGIPSGSWSNCVTTACNTAFSTPTVANINAACSGAPNNAVVLIPAGSYTFSSSVHCNRGNVALKGAGTQQTFITLGSGANLLMGGPGTNGQGSYPSGIGIKSWTGGLTQGSTVLTLGSTSGLSAGQTVILTQQNASYVFPDGVEGTCTSGNSCGVNPVSLSFTGAETYAQIQEVSIVSVSSGANQITVAAPGVGFTASSGLSPTLFYWNTPSNAQYAGIENMTVNANGNDRALSLPFCDYCWVKNVAVTNAARSGVFFYFGYRDEVRDSYISASNTTGAPTEYGIEILESTLTKAENNVLFGVTSPYMTEGSYATVLGYNYTLNTSPGAQFGDLNTHLSHAYMQLWEGNVGGTATYDNSWGSSSHMTSFRNRMSGNTPNKTNYRIAMKVNAQNHYVNMAGNVIGDPTHHTQYVSDLANQQSTDNFVYELGYWNSYDHGTSQYDPATESSLVRWGNWDAVTYCTNGGHGGTACGSTGSNGVRYCTGSGVGNSACTASETASTDPTFPGLASPSSTLPASFYTGVTSVHASCGTGLSFWKNPSTGACPNYPPIGPDVACTTNCIANTANHAAMIPAQLCYTNTAKDSNGFLTAFDANACYANDTSSNNGPAAPTGLAAVVQ
jgi:hypothetical protein